MRGKIWKSSKNNVEWCALFCFILNLTFVFLPLWNNTPVYLGIYIHFTPLITLKKYCFPKINGSFLKLRYLASKQWVVPYFCSPSAWYRAKNITPSTHTSTTRAPLFYPFEYYQYAYMFYLYIRISTISLSLMLYI